MYSSQAKYMAGVREDSPTGTAFLGNGNGNGFQQDAAMKKKLGDGPSDYAQIGSSVLGDDRLAPLPMHTRTERRLSVGSTYSSKYVELSAKEGLLGPKRPKPHKIWKKKYIKLMVVGDSGLGKTTLVKSLMSTPGERMQVHDGSYTPSEQFRKDPDSLLSTVTWRDEEDRVIWVYKIQDTPGYGDDLNFMNSITMMKGYIERQNLKWLELEQSTNRKEDLSEVEDPRVDLCIFCIPPHRLRPMDLYYMYEISQHVPILPVVTKADTMTIREAQIYRQEVANKIANPMMPGIRDKINMFKFERDTLERAGVADSSLAIPPFLVIASNDINEELNSADPPVFWPERRYPWGTAEAFNREHSDQWVLRALLLKEALEEISKTKRSRYEDWRRKQLGGPQIGRRLLNIAIWTFVPAFICLQLGRAGTTMKDIKDFAGKQVRRFKRKSVEPAAIAAGAVSSQAKPPVVPAHYEPKKRWPL